jgi:nitrogen fixation protein FixH
MMSNLSNHSGEGDRRRSRELTGRTVLFCLVAFFAVVFAVNAVMVSAAVTTFGGLETASSYQAGLTFGREIAAAEAQQARHWQVNAALRPEGGGSTVIELSARDRAGRPLIGLDSKVLMIHPTNRRLDHPVEMSAGGSGRFHGAVTTEAGQWDLVIELSRGGERLFRSRERVILR